MARIFVSYNRKNIEFCKQLTDELLKRDLDLWVDWEDIPPTVDWLKEIEKGVEEADTFLAIITNEWIGSRNCTIELEYAVKNGKRLIPVVPYDIVWSDVPPDLALLNFIFFTEKFDFNSQLEKLFTALDTDYDWLKTHRRLQVKALDWERSNKENGYLLRGKDLEEAEQQISINANKDPHPTDLQREYVLTSRQATDRQRRRNTGVLAFIILMLFGATAYFATPRVLDWMAQSRARGEMIPISEGPSVFGAEDPVYVNDFGFPPLQTIPSLPAFQIQKYEVSNYQYGQCVKYGDCTVPVVPIDFEEEEIQDLPIVNVTVFQASTYCQWLGQRLPTQFEWERAARGPELYEWPWGNEHEPTSSITNMPWNGHVPTSLQPIDSHLEGVSPEGIFNLVGNVSEWTSSFVEGMTTYDPTRFWDGIPENYNGNMAYAQRGGGWVQGVDEVGLFIAELGTSARNDLGFRCATDVK